MTTSQCCHALPWCAGVYAVPQPVQFAADAPSASGGSDTLQTIAGLLPDDYETYNTIITVFTNFTGVVSAVAADALLVPGLYSIAVIFKMLETIMENNRTADVSGLWLASDTGVPWYVEKLWTPLYV